MLAKSHIFSEIRNKVGGIVYTKSRYGAIIGRAGVKPVDVNSNALEDIRNQFNNAAIFWKALSIAERDAWEFFAANTPWKNALGDDIKLTGQAMYIGQVCAFMGAFPTGDRTQYDTAPCAGGLFATPTVDIDCCTNPDIGIVVTVTNNDPGNQMNAIVRISSPQSPSKNWYKGPYNYMAAIPLLGIAAEGSDDAEFCDICAGRYFVEVRGFDGTNGNNMSSLTYQWADACTLPP